MFIRDTIKLNICPFYLKICHTCDETLPITESHIAYKKIVHVVLHKICSCLLEQKKFPCQSKTVMFIDFQIFSHTSHAKRNIFNSIIFVNIHLITFQIWTKYDSIYENFRCIFLLIVIYVDFVESLHTWILFFVYSFVFLWH